MRHLFAVVVLATVSLFAAADAQLGVTAPDPSQACLENVRGGTAAEALAQQQVCCKANKGICGCRAGKIVCCDMTFAEGCTCNREDAPPIS